MSFGRKRSRGMPASVSLTTRALLAYQAGYRLAGTHSTLQDAQLAVVDHADTALTMDEQMAYAQLLPATWWARFNNGFSDGKAKRR